MPSKNKTGHRLDRKKYSHLRLQRKNSPDERSYRCPNGCGSSFGEFCFTCGENQSRSGDYSLVSQFSEAFEVVTNLAKGSLRSFWKLIVRPGFLTVEYFEGRRKPYLKPLQIFLFCNIIFFFVQSYTRFNTPNTPLDVHIQGSWYSGYAHAKVSKTIIDRGITLEKYQSSFDDTIESLSKTLVVLMIPMFALLLPALFWGARDYFAEHLVFSIHFFSFFLLILSADLLLTSAIAYVAPRFSRLDAIFDGDRFFTVVLLAACLSYLLFAVRRKYIQTRLDFEYTFGWVNTVLKCLILIAWLMAIVQCYRFCLFFTAFYWV